VIAFTVPGRARPKGRPRVDTRGATPHAYTPAATKAFEEIVFVTARCAAAHPMRGPVAVEIRFFGAAGDVDNLCKAVLDGMRRACYEDDRQVVELRASLKRRDRNPRTEVVVRSAR
jgi:Holliday junction resolvase RusA-like endonuclease